jgi:ABC-type multidrug transport system fused ATPase/permease subunit
MSNGNAVAPERDGASAKRRWGPYWRLFDGSGRLIAASVLISVAQASLLVPVAIVVKRAFDTYIPNGDARSVALGGALILVLYVASAALGLLTRYLVLKTTKTAITGVRVNLLERIYTLSRTYFDQHSSGKLHSIIVQDSERLDVVSNALVGVLIPAAMVSVGLSVIALVLNPLLLAALACVVPIMIVVGRLLARRVRARTRIWQRAFDVFSAQTALALRAMTLIKVHGAERIELERRSKEIAALGDAGREMAWRSGAYLIVQQAITASAGVVVLVIGGWATAKGDMTLGELLAFYAIVALLLRQVSLAVAVLPVVLTGYESIARLEDVLAADYPEPYSGTRRLPFHGGVELDDVTFSYGREPLLRDVSLAVGPGEHVALVGPNGAGKSTLVSLVLGLYRPQHGSLLADGVPYDDLDMPALRRRAGVVLQDPVILPGTIAENIAYGRPAATDGEIKQAARWATADDFVSALPEGYTTRVGDEGVLLSGGQRQRIAIARSLLARPVLLILDEPTTHLDDRSIARLMANLRELPGSPTLLLISHDLEVARLAERVYLVRDGMLVDEAPSVPGGA